MPHSPSFTPGRLAVVVQRYGAEVNGGAESHARTLALALRDRGHTVEILTSRALNTRNWEAHYPAGESWLDGIRVLRFDHPVRPHRGRQHMPLRHKLRWALRRLLARPGRPEVARPSGNADADGEHYLVNQGPATYGLLQHLSAEGESYQAVFFFTTLFFPTAFGVLVQPSRSILVPTLHDEKAMFLPHFHRVFRAPACTLFNTESEAALARRLYGSDLSPYAVCGLGINIPDGAQRRAARQHLADMRTRHGIHKPYLLYLGRVDAGKGCDQLFAYWQALPLALRNGLHLVVVGQLHMPAPQANDILCTGFANPEDRDAWLEGCEALVNPSAHESLSLVLLEAMARGVPVLINPRSPVMVDHVRASGVGHHVHDNASFARALHTVVTRSPAERERQATLAQAYVHESYSWARVMQRLRWAIDLASAPGRQQMSQSSLSPKALPLPPCMF